MNPDYYANEYRRYQTYVRNYNPEHPVKKICCGANVDDYEWTSDVLKTCFHHCKGKSTWKYGWPFSALLCTSGGMGNQGKRYGL